MEANEQLLDDSSPKRRKSKTVFRLKAAGVALVVTVGAVWLVRIPLMNLAIRGYLDAQGVNATFEGDGISFARVELEQLRLGPAKNPDLTAERAEVYLDWDGFSPKVESVILENPVLNAKADRTGVSFGSLDLFRPEPTEQPFALPHLGLTVREGRVNVATPYGTVIAYVETKGQLDRDFSLSLRARSVVAPGTTELLEGLIFTGSAETSAKGIHANVEGGAASVNAAGLIDGLRTGAFRFESEFTSAPDLTRLSGFIKGTAERVIQTDDTGASAVAMAVTLKDVRLTPQLRPTAWDGAASISAAAARAGNLTVQQPDIQASFTGTKGRGSGQWTVTTGALEGPTVRLRATRAKGDLKVEMGDAAPVVAATGTLSIADGVIAPRQRAKLREGLARLESTPLAGLVSQSSRTLDRAMRQFQASAPLSVTWSKGFGELIIPGAVEATGQGGVRFTLLDHDHDQPVLRTELPSGKTMVTGRASLSGPGLPKLEALIDRLSTAPGQALESAGTVVVADWKAGDSSLSLTPVTYKLMQDSGKGEVELSGLARISGPIPGGRIEDLHLPLDVAAAWDKGVRLSAKEGCLNVKIGGLSIGDYRFGQGAMPVCPRGDRGFLWTSPEGALTGGATAGELRLALLGTDGAPEGGADAGLGLKAGPIAVSVRGTTDRPIVGLDFRQATLRLEGGITAESRRIHGSLTGGKAGWRGNGTMDGFTLVANEAAVRAEAKGRWRADFNNDAAPLQLTGLSGQVADMNSKARFEPLAFTDGEARLGGPVATMRGNVRLASSGDVLGQVEARHDTNHDVGDLVFRLTGLTFSPSLQPYMLTEAARGVVENVTGTVGGFVRARWTAEQLKTDAQFDLKALSMATGGLGPVEGISGHVVLTDFLGMKTPPGQKLTVAKVNPGVAMENGEFRFQLLGDQKLKVERAGWPLADGELLVDPTVVALSEPEKRVTLRIAEVDLEKFIGLMNLESLRATGRVEGELPLVITRQGAAIRNGYLRTKGSGTLSYTGPVPAAEGNAKLAFDALKNFKFQSIVVDVDGDLAGEVATGIHFEGTSQASLSPLSWFRALRTRGIPFKFNVNVKAPLRSLMSSISGVSDVGGLVRRSVEMELEKSNDNNGKDTPKAENGGTTKPKQR